MHAAGIVLYAASATFALAGLTNLWGGGHLRGIYRLWHYPRHFWRVAGVTELLVALFLILPQTRVWGVLGGGVIAAVTVVTLLHHRQYLWSLPAMLLLLSLVPAWLARP